MEKMKRTATCGELTRADAGKVVVLNGWVHRNRDHGGIQFINLRDRYGVTQVVVDEDASELLKETAKALKFEYCVAIEGAVRVRPDSMVNPDMSTGEIEIQTHAIEVLSESEVLPFMVDEKSEAREDLRLKYRYLDLRSFGMQKNLRVRHDVAFAVREFLNHRGFLEIETPTFIKSTPEGARDFLVPSRINPGKFYALPQSPQIYKQLLMVSGFDKYFQIARCYRDEDARGDRQPEFTQIDIEMSFVSREEIFELTEGLMVNAFKAGLGVDLPTPFPRLAYHDAMNRYGSDKPDLRFDMPMRDFDDFARDSSFKVFSGVAAKGGSIKVLVVPGAAHFSRKQITELEDTAKTYGALGLAWMKYGEDGLDGGIAKFFQNQQEAIRERYALNPGDLLLFVASDWNIACTALGAVRSRLGDILELTDDRDFKFCWIIDFPLFEWNADNEKWDPAHHMFSMPQERYLDSMEENPGEVLGDLYDLVCNGLELASGSIRVHDPEIQKRIFKIVGFAEEEAEKRFGFLLNAFRYGPPPHGGIAPGLDRLIMIMTGDKSIREVIAFPKNTVGLSPMDDSPSSVDKAQLDELHLALAMPEEENKKQKED